MASMLAGALRQGQAPAGYALLALANSLYQAQGFLSQSSRRAFSSKAPEGALPHITSADLAEKLRAGGKGLVVLDVREAQVRVCHGSC